MYFIRGLSDTENGEILAFEIKGYDGPSFGNRACAVLLLLIVLAMAIKAMGPGRAGTVEKDLQIDICHEETLQFAEEAFEFNKVNKKIQKFVLEESMHCFQMF